MNIEVGEHRELILREVYLPITLISTNGDEMHIVMRDGGFEGVYQAKGSDDKILFRTTDDGFGIHPRDIKNEVPEELAQRPLMPDEIPHRK